MRIKAGAFAVEMANVRHEHEGRIWENQKLPDGVKLIPGVISHQTNVVEHPELVCERIVRLTNLVGPENVIAGTDCGFAQATYLRRVHPTIQWAKLRTLVEGARLASKILWRRKSPARRAKTKRNAAR
jgi:5-methyltetrahydropteroyltriglutamate--homocysteine methyltransferase